MPTYVIPAVYDTAKKYIRPIGRGERLLPEYFGIVLDGLLSENAGQSLTVDAAGKLHCLAVSRDARNLIAQGTDKGAYLDASQILSNGATNLLTTNPLDRRVMLTKQSLLDAGLADATTVYGAMQEHLEVIAAAKAAAATSAATAKAGATTVTRYITEAESVIREEAAGIAAESITAQVVSQAAEKASELVDNRQDRSIAALTTRVNQVETDSANELNTLNANWTQNFTSVTRTNVEQSEVIAQIIDKNNSQDRAIKDLQDVDVRHDERLNFLKCTTEALDARIYQNFVCLVNRISDSEERIKDYITTEVTRLEDEIRRINATQAAAWTNISRTLSEQAERFLKDETQHKKDVKDIYDRITNEVDTLNDRITDEVGTLNARIATEVTRLDEEIIETNATIAENFVRVARTDSEQSERIFKNEIQHKQDVEDIYDRITDEVNRLDDEITETNASVAENFAKVALTDTEQAATIVDIRNDVDVTDRRLSENIVRQERINIEQYENVLEFKQHQLNNVARFSDLAYASVVHTREIQSLDFGFVTLCANVVSLVRMNLEQALMFFTIVGSTISIGDGAGSSVIDFGDMG